MQRPRPLLAGGAVGRRGDALVGGVTRPGQSAPVAEMAIRAAFSSMIELSRANAAVSALTAMMFTARG